MQQLALNTYRGDCYHWVLTFWNDEGGTDPYDLTDAVAKAEIRAKPGSPVLGTLETTVVLPNTIELDLTAAQSAALTGKPQWDLQLTYPDGCVKTVVAGTISVTADITDST